MNIFTSFFSVITFLLLSITSVAQNTSVIITGTVQDTVSKNPMPYVKVAVGSKHTQMIYTGATTDDNGHFRIETDSTGFYIEISFMGYEKKVLREFQINNGFVDLGTILLAPDTENLSEVNIRAEKSTLEFKLDKRVFNVGKDISSTGMGALEVLDNVPSVNVTIEGEIMLRGNSGVQIFIDGKPSVLSDEGSNALGTLTADMIEKIEVITNPSAKYEAGGTSGIINIVLKKEEKKGWNGSLSANTGIPDNHSVGISLNRRTEKLNLFTQFGAGFRSMPRYNESINHNLKDDTLIKSEGIAYRNEQFVNITLGTDYYINANNTLTLSGNFAHEWEDQPSETEFMFYDENDQLITSYTRRETTTATNPKWQYDLQYEKKFKKKEDHVLLFSTLGRFFGKDLSSEFNNTTTIGTDAWSNQQTRTDFYRSDYTFKLDYINPITKKITLEAGGMYEINDVGNDYAVLNQINGVWATDSSLTNNFEYNQKVLGMYSTGAYESKKWGVKLGFRLENTDLNTLLTNTGESNKQNYTNFFPSVHTSYKFSDLMSVQAGYSRRIFRPRLWDLNPFFNIRNNYSIRTGNPDLQPEFADSYELTGIFFFKSISFNTSVYHLYTTNVVERVSTFEDNVNITKPLNIGTNRKTGFEVTGKYSVNKWLTLNGEFNYGFFDRKGAFGSQDFEFSGNQWSSSLTGKFKLPAGFDLEVAGNQESGYKTVQGEVSGFIYSNIGVRKKIAKGKLILNLAVRDVFASRIQESRVEQSDFYLYTFSQRGRFITFGASYSFGKGEAMTYSGGRRFH